MPGDLAIVFAKIQRAGQACLALFADVAAENELEVGVLA